MPARHLLLGGGGSKSPASKFSKLTITDGKHNRRQIENERMVCWLSRLCKCFSVVSLAHQRNTAKGNVTRADFRFLSSLLWETRMQKMSKCMWLMASYGCAFSLLSWIASRDPATSWKIKTWLDEKAWCWVLHPDGTHVGQNWGPTEPQNLPFC